MLALIGCGEDGDAGVANACREFRAIASDAEAGVLTDAEMVGRARVVHEKAQGSEDEAFREAAAALARDVTDPSSGVIPAFGDACDSRGE
jgi:hypothetical protein